MIQVPKGSASEWVIEEVVQFIMSTDPALAVHADVFRKHVSHSLLIRVVSFMNILLEIVFLLIVGNRWRSIIVAEFKYDDETYGSEIGPSFENLQYNQPSQQ